MKVLCFLFCLFRLSDDRKPSVHSSVSYSEIISQEGSPLCYDIHSQGMCRYKVHYQQ